MAQQANVNDISEDAFRRNRFVAKSRRARISLSPFPKLEPKSDTGLPFAGSTELMKRETRGIAYRERMIETLWVGSHAGKMVLKFSVPSARTTTTRWDRQELQVHNSIKRKASHAHAVFSHTTSDRTNATVPTESLRPRTGRVAHIVLRNSNIPHGFFRRISRNL
jgi:hypothetical protein